jgi:GNAT superfamily N-acetyltransferase
MQIEDIIEQYPKTIKLTNGRSIVLRPLKRSDEKAFHEFFARVPETERVLFKHRVTDIEVIRDWCGHIDYGKILPMLALDGDRIVADASLHQTLGGWKRHIGRVSMVVDAAHRGKGIARVLLKELVGIARNIGLEHLEAEFMGNQKAARHVFALMGFEDMVVRKDYVKDMQAITHDYVLMGRRLVTDEEYTGAN